MKIAFTGTIAGLSRRERERLLGRSPSPRGGPPSRAGKEETARQVRALLTRVRRDGDAALFEMAREFDGVDLEALEVPRARWLRALDRLDPAVREALERAARNIERFHSAQLPPEATAGVEVEIEPGVVLGRRAVPLRAAGIYAPGGRAAYPSSVLMGVLPARAAGVGEIVLCSPPGDSGEPSPQVMAACALAGATRLFAVGGAGAVAALAFGTESIPRTDAVVGPGNRWVTEAKRQIAGDVVIDSPAGPSEVLIVADGDPEPDDRHDPEARVDPDAWVDANVADNPDTRFDPDAPKDADARNDPHVHGDRRRANRALLVARELIAQAEHDPDAAVALVTDSPELLEAVKTALAPELEKSPRRSVVEEALASRGALLLASSAEGALEFAQAFAAEHLVLLTRNPRRDLTRVTTSGTVFLGEPSSVPFGDYMTGANHVLPTGGRARTFSGLSTLHFLRFFTYQELNAEGARALSGPTACLAEAEGLPGHARAARSRSIR